MCPQRLGLLILGTKLPLVWSPLDSSSSVFSSRSFCVCLLDDESDVCLDSPRTSEPDEVIYIHILLPLTCSVLCCVSDQGLFHVPVLLPCRQSTTNWPVTLEVRVSSSTMNTSGGSCLTAREPKRIKVCICDFGSMYKYQFCWIRSECCS